MLKTKVIKDWSKVEKDNEKILRLGDYKYGIETYTLQNKELIRQSGKYVVCNAQGKAMDAEVFIYAEGGRIELQEAPHGVGSADGVDGVFVYTGGLKKFKEITGEKEISRGKRKYNNCELLPGGKLRSGGKDWWVNRTLGDVVYFTDEKYVEMLAKPGNGSGDLFNNVRGVYWESDF